MGFIGISCGFWELRPYNNIVGFARVVFKLMSLVFVSRVVLVVF